MSQTIQRAQPTALARSAARQLNRSMDDQSIAANGGRLTLRDVAELPPRSATLRAPRLGADAQGAVARAMARQSGVTLEQLQYDLRHAARLADSSATPVSGLGTSQLPANGGQTRPHHGQHHGQNDKHAVEQHTATAHCDPQNMLAMCADLQGSVAATGEQLLDALVISLVARCLNVHRALRASPSDRLGGDSEAVNVAIAMRIDGQWHMPVLHNLAHLGIAAIAQQLSALARGAAEQALSHNSKLAHRDALSIFNVPAQMHSTLRTDAANGASLTITPMLQASLATCGRHASGAGDDERLLALRLAVDARRANAASCAAFLADLTAMFAEPRRALL